MRSTSPETQGDPDEGVGTYRQLAGDIAVVTGGAKGLGAATAEALGRRGAKVIVADLSRTEVDAAVARLREASIDAEGIVMDVTDGNSVDAAQKFIVRAHGDIAILINNAGVAGMVNFGDEGSQALWDRVIDVNLSGVYRVTLGFLEQLKRTCGRVVNLSSVTAFTSGFTNTGYVASKGGVRSLTQMLARELGEFGIRVNAVAPGYFDTDMGMKGTAHGDSWINWHCPMRRFGEPYEIGGPISFLVSAEASYVNGVTLPVDGGYLVV